MAGSSRHSPWWADRSMRAKGLIVVSLPLVALFVTIPLVVYSYGQARNAESVVAHTLEVRSRIEGVRASALDAASRLRGYLLTGSPSFLSAYQAAAGNLPASIASLATLTSDSPVQAHRSDQLRTISYHLTRVLDQLAQARAGDKPVAFDQAGILQSQVDVDQMSTLLDAMRTDEDRVLVEREAAARSAEVRTIAVAVVAVTSGLLGGMAAVLLFAAGVARRIRRLEENAGLLAEGQPLLPTPEGKDEIGRLGRALEVAGDLLQERQRALTQSEEQLRAIIDHSPSAIFMKDREGRFLVVNRAFEDIFNVRRKDAIGKTVRDLLPSDSAFPRAENDRAVLEGRVPMQFEETAPAADGEHVFLSTKVPVLDESGQPYGLVGVSTDITERKRNEIALQSAREEAERANRAKSEFLSRMSHELRTPLNAILGFGQLLEMDELDDERTEYVQHILKGGRHLLDLINEVLDIARVETGRMNLSLEPVALSEVIREGIDLIRPLAADQLIELRVAPSCPGYVQADRQRLKQALLNLLSNAIKYNRKGGTVAVQCREGRDGDLRVEVSDEGPGIRPEFMQRLFVPFERLGAEGTPVEGTGLGLALSKGLVEAMGGTLGATSELGRGSTFFIELPSAEPPGRAEEPETAQAAAIRRPGGSHTVLYIEDNLANLSLIQSALRRRPGLVLLTALQGSMGLDLARQHQPDLILLDLHLPDVPGAEVLVQLQGDPRTRHIPVVVISADATPGRIRDLLAAGARAYLTKPIDVSRFFDVVDGILAELRLDDAV